MKIFYKGKLLLMVMGLALMALVLAACGSSGATPVQSVGAQGNAQSDTSGIANLLRSQLGAEAYQQLVQGNNGTSTGIWVSGQGRVTAAPDLAILNLGVEAFAGTVAEARGEAAVAMTQVLEALRSAGIAERDIQTRFFNINSR